ncbi:ABC transporter ATP-binding protein [Seonamhaeicola sp. S2-3]|uniref:peptidase domain-containing ABC transporter n=1 Tax=Seonamhaeicola sp. S2-3 TaxID=1936081 RepID=UPI000972A301|nr:peptidase domain-containing ABC transporter [Seonamhaeicola sp. S2-3]APY12150.1 ABC transporter ATP-binding protein [Seonamhaeicola sp. S2-3]
MKKITLSIQYDTMDCGPTCIKMIASYFGRNYSLQFLRNLSYISREGVSLLGISQALEKIGFEVTGSKLNLKELTDEFKLPCILHWNQNHFVVLQKISTSLFSSKHYYHIADPAHGFIKLNEESFKKSWLQENDSGISLFINPTEEFYKQTPENENTLNIKYLFKYLKPYKKQLAFMFLFLLIGSGLTLIFPFLTEALIDKGVNQKNLSVISIVLMAQLAVFFGTIVIDIVRNWLTLYVGTHISITIISDFLKKTLQLPIKFFDTKLMGDFRQRIQDNDRIEEFLTSQSLITFFSIITFSVFFCVLWYYDFKILLIYVALTTLAILWSLFWLKKRKILDYYRFQQRSENQESIYEMLNGVTEIKLNQFENFKRNQWEHIQQKLFKLNTRILKLDQIQLSGFEFFNQLKNIIVTFLAATYVVQGSMTLGMLLAISYIIGQMNSPVNQLVSFFRSLQDAKLSLERLNEVQNHPIEEINTVTNKNIKPLSVNKLNTAQDGINIQNLSFQYEGPKSPFVLKDINFLIPQGKITAIVGASGSGKTTLIKLLLRFYNPTAGNIYFNSENIIELSPKSIRENCGIVMQDGYIFSETIERNIVIGDENINQEKLKKALRIANIEDFIESLPLKLQTKIGVAGNGISGGQKQRILIARAVYKNPQYIIFDEATSALDAENEKIIHDNLQGFFKGKTVVVVAHRLSTVKNANKIIVLNKGKVVEQGNHITLVKNKSYYFNLIKNQLELGN